MSKSKVKKPAKKMTSHGKKDKHQAIQVFVRVRPLQDGSATCMEIRNCRELVVKYHNNTKTYQFDRVFGPNSKQIDVYKHVAEPLVREVINGYNCTILAYGQTGTGKTYTMAGDNPGATIPTQLISWKEDAHSGIIPRTLSHMFDELQYQNVEFSVRVSYLELYNEEIYDLLSPVDDVHSKIKLYDDAMKKGSVIVNGLAEMAVQSKAEVFKILEEGALKRRFATTMVNTNSSRSHTVFCVMIHTRENNIHGGEDLLKTGKLYLVDLAGSENIKQSGATDARARETASINQSLLTLGRCITKLVDRCGGHIPYRESKLTRLLQDSLGGRTKTTLIATVSPAPSNLDESVNTLDYAFRAKNITNKPEVNQRLTKKMLIKDYSDEIERLRKDLLASRQGKGILMDEENYMTIIKERDMFKGEIAEKFNLIFILREEMKRKEDLCDELKIAIIQQQKLVEEKVGTISELESELRKASEEIHVLQDETKLQEFIVEKHSETEQQLKSAAKELLTVADTTTSESHKLHDKLDILTDITKQNKQTLEQQLGDLNNKMQGVDTTVRTFHDRVHSLHNNIKSISSEIKESSAQTIKNVANYVETLMPIRDNVTGIDDEMQSVSDLVNSKTRTIESIYHQHFDKVKNQNAGLHTNYLLPAVNELYKIIIEREEHISHCVDKLNECHDDLVHTVLKRNEQMKRELEENKKMMASQIEDLFSTYAVLEEKHDQENQMMQDVQNDLDQKYEEILSLAKSVKKMSTDYGIKQNTVAQNAHAKISTWKTVLDNLSEMHNSQADEILKQTELVSQETQTKDKNYKNDSLALEMQIKQLDENFNAAKTKVDKSLKERSLQDKQNFDGLEDACYDEIADLRDTLLDQLDKPSMLVAKSAADLRLFQENIAKDKIVMLDGVPRLVKKLDKEVDEHEKYCIETESVVSTEIDNCCEGMRRLFSGSFKEYKVTGETPQRKSYKYPRVLAETKPKEILVEEFYSSRVQEQISEDDEKENDSDNANIENIQPPPPETYIPIRIKPVAKKDEDKKSDLKGAD